MKSMRPPLVAIFYRLQRSCGQGNIFTPVCHSFCSQGGSASVHAGIPPPLDQTPPPPPGIRHPPPPRSDNTTPPPDQTPPPWDQTPPWIRHHPPGSDTTTPDQTPPPPQIRHPPDQTPPRSDPPGTGRPPPSPVSRLQHTVYERPVRILLECILFYDLFSQGRPPSGSATAAMGLYI